jgi:tripartite ATP-independent transporter DctP family solute receptor
MRSTRSRRSTAAAVTAVALMLAACGGSGATAPAAPAPTAPAPSTGGTTPPVDTRTFTLSYASALGPQSAEAMAMEVFKEYVEKESAGRITVELFPGGALGGVAEGVQQTVSGAISMTHAAPSWWQQVSPGIGVMELPYLFTSTAQARKALDGDLGELIAEEMYASGLKVLGWYDLGFRHVLNNVRPVQTGADLKGLTIRFQNNPTHLDAFAALGSNPIPLDWSEVYPSMQQGVVDGVENSLGIVLSANLYEVGKYLSLTSHVHGSMAIAMNRATWDDLPADLQEIILEGSRLSVAYQRAETEKLAGGAIEALRGFGVEVNEVPQALLTVLVMFGGALAVLRSDHVRITLIEDSRRGWSPAAGRAIAHASFLLFGLAIMWLGFELLGTVGAQRTGVLQLPLRYPVSSFPLAGAAIVLHSLAGLLGAAGEPREDGGADD